MLVISCLVCPAPPAFADCACPPGHDPAANHAHHGTCPMSDLGALLECVGQDCCDGSAHPGMSHDASANTCASSGVSHEGAACPAPAGACHLWTHLTSQVEDPGDMPENCPGGHCHKDLPDCLVCRPVRIQAVGKIQAQRAEA